MKRIDSAQDLQGKRCIVRADFNVPVQDGAVIEPFRVEKTYKTIDYILDNGGKVILLSHFEGEGGSLRPVSEFLRERYDIQFVDSYFPDQPEISKSVVLFENTRKYAEEKGNDENFSKHLSGFADLYVNEAFPSSHRAHASIVGVPKFLPHYAGFSFVREVEELTKVLHPLHPFVFILGGAKFDTKLPLIKKFFSLADKMFIGGALANDFLKAKGYEVGNSLISPKHDGIETFEDSKLIIPQDLIVNRGGKKITIGATEVEKEDVIVDVGPRSIEELTPYIQSAQFILWNGPLGSYEGGYKDSTLALAEIIGKSRAQSVVGGGDTVASIAELGLSDSITFISAGGGAMLEFLANETLPGIEALA
jgi:phosphoglycerate kinase